MFRLMEGRKDGDINRKERFDLTKDSCYFLHVTIALYRGGL